MSEEYKNILNSNIPLSVESMFTSHMGTIMGLLESGVSPFACNRQGITPLMYAVCMGNLDIVKLLIEKGVDPETCTYPNNMTNRFLKNIRNVYSIDSHRSCNTNKTPALILAVKNKRDNVIKYLLEDLKVNPNTTDNKNNIALHYSYLYKEMDSLEPLFKKSKIDSRNYRGKTPLMMAVKHNNFTNFEKLLKSGASVNSVTKEGRSVAEMCVRLGDERYLTTLIEYGFVDEGDKIYNFAISQDKYFLASRLRNITDSTDNIFSFSRSKIKQGMSSFKKSVLRSLY